MKIGLYINSFGGGGAERVVSRLSEILASNGQDVYVIISDSSEMAYPVSGVFVPMQIATGSGISKLIVAWKRILALKRIKMEFNLDVVVSFLTPANCVNVLSKVNGCKSYVSIRNYESFDNSSLKKGLLKLLIRFIYSKSDYIVSCSKEIKMTVVNRLGIPESKIGVLYNPYNQKALLENATSDCDEAYKEFASKHRFMFATTGRLSHQKGFWHLVKIVNGLREKGIDVGCFLIGKGDQEEKLRRLIKTMNCEEAFCFCGFQKNPMAIESLCDAYIMTSLFEGFPNALVEAICIGLPVITADCKSGPREILSNASSLDSYEYDQGFLLPAFEPDEDWTRKLSCTDQMWINYLTEDRLKNLKKKKQHCLEKGKVFDYKTCYENLMLMF